MAGKSKNWLRTKKIFYEGFCFRRDMAWYFVLQMSNFPEQFFIVMSFKWKFSTNHDIEKDSKGSHIRELPQMLLFSNKFRSHIARRTAKHIQLLVFWYNNTETKIDDLNPVILINHYVFELDIPMDYIFGMTVLYSFSYLIEDSLCNLEA